MTRKHTQQRTPFALGALLLLLLLLFRLFINVLIILYFISLKLCRLFSRLLKTLIIIINHNTFLCVVAAYLFIPEIKVSFTE